jgi:predicted alpha/beta-hydrolase family hydrolase
VLWNPAASAVKAVLVLAHGAGSDLHHSLLAELAVLLSQQGVTMVRFNFPYRENGRGFPDPAARLEHCWRDVVAHVRSRVAGEDAVPLFIGGKSMGGRMASHLVAAGEPVDGLVCLGYPLHPPRRIDNPRSQHLVQLGCPSLFIQGTRDPHCDLNRLALVLAPLGLLATVHIVEGADHDFRVLKRCGRSAAQVMAEIAGAVAAWLEAVVVAARH